MRNPNGYGTAYRLSGKRRKPFVAKVTSGWSDNGKQLYQIIGYYAKKAEALSALAEYHKNPNYIDVKNITFEDIFNRWKKIKYGDNKCLYDTAFGHAATLHKMNFINIIADDMKKTLKGLGHSSRNSIKSLYNQLYDYAIANKIININYAKFVKVGENTEPSKRKVFTSQEISVLWENIYKDEDIDLVLIYLYTGLRASELLLIKNSNINLEERYMRGGLKTKAGKDRVIPLHKDIIPLIKARMSENEYLILNSEGNKMQYSNYYFKRFMPLMEVLNMQHTPHDTRHTFATIMDNVGANKLSIKRILGHSSKDVTEGYTHKDIEELIKAIDLFVVS